MGLLEMFTDVSLILPAIVAIGTVVLTVLAIFWFGLGKTRTFEEAKALASRQADLVLQEEYRNSPRAKKGRKQFPRKKKVDHWEESRQETTPEPPKGILKSNVEPTPDKSPRSNRVEFNIAMEKEGTSTRSNPPTPHPSKAVPSVFKPQEELRTPQPLFEEPEEEIEPISKPPPPVETKKTSSSPPKTSKASSDPSPRAGVSGKKKSRAKKDGEVIATGREDGLSVSRIVEIVGASPLTDDDIQQLVSALLEKINTNSEWEAANFRSESVKSLKKQNQELLQRCSEAEQTVHSHHSKIKELRAEIQNERMKQQATEAKLQAKITSHTNDMSVIKSRLFGLEEENKLLKAHSTATTLNKLEGENEQLRGQVHKLTVASKALSLQVKDTAEENVALKTELARMKEAPAGSRGAAQDGVRLTELEGLVRDMEQEKQQLQLTMQALNDDNSRLKTEVASVQATSTGELEALKAKTVSLEAANSSLSDDKTALLRNVEQLKADNETLANEKLTLAAEKEVLVANNASMAVEKARLETLNANKANAEDTSVTLKAQYDEQLAGVQQEMSGRVAELEGRCDEREREVAELTAQIEKCSTLKDELKTLSVQLSSEQTAKKELELELTALKQAAAGTDQPDSASQEELAQLREEKAELKETVKQLEQKLTDIKDKNNTLRDSVWKAKDEAAEEVKAQQAKLKEAYQKSEALCKAAKKEALEEAWENHKSFLVQLVPTVTVEESDPIHWLDTYEIKVKALLSDKDQQVTALESKVSQLQEREQKNIQEAERLRNTMEATMGILERLQSEVEGDNAAHQKNMQEKDEMIERERATNRRLQEELKKEQDKSILNKEAVQRAEEAEALLKETKQLCQQEADDLRQSLLSEQEAKDKLQAELEAVQASEASVKTQLKAAEEGKANALAQVTNLQTEIKQMKASRARKSTTPPPQVHTEV